MRSSRLISLACLGLAVLGSWLALPILARGATAEAGATNVRSFGAVGDGVHDDTAAIQKAIDSSPRVFLPAGTYLIDPKIGLVVRNGTQIIGDGRAQSLLLAAPGGGSVQDLAAYRAGSIVRRAFDPSRANPYVSYVRIADVGIVLSHPQDRITPSAIQIGLDLRNISRAIIERVHVGNVAPLGSKIGKPKGHTFDSQGYGIVLGTVSSSSVAYAGGEGNTVRDTSIWGTYKSVVQDDSELSPLSASHSTVIERSDLQGAEFLLSQESRYARGIVWRDNILQNIVPRNDHPRSGTAYTIMGQDASVSGDYVELGPLAERLVDMGQDTRNVNFAPTYVDCSSKPGLSNLGRNNVITRRAVCDG